MFRSPFNITSAEKTISEKHKINGSNASRALEQDTCVSNLRRVTDQTSVTDDKAYQRLSTAKQDDLQTWKIHEVGLLKLHTCPEESLKYFQELFSGSSKTMDSLGLHLAWSGIVESILFEGKDYRAIDYWIEQYDVIGGLVDECDPVAVILAKASLFNALVMRRPDHPALKELAHEIAAGLQIWNELVQVPLLANRLMHYYVWTGNVADAASIIGIVRHRLERYAYDLNNTACLLSTLAMYNWFIGKPGECYDTVRKGLTWVKRSCDTVWIYQLNIHGAYAALYEKNPAKMDEFLEQIRKMDFSGNRIDNCHYHLLATWFEVLKNNFSAAFEHGNTSLSFARALGAPILEAFSQLALTQIQLEQGQEVSQFDEHRLRKMVESSGSELLEHLEALVNTQTLLKKGETRNAVEKLQTALRFAKDKEHKGLPWWTDRSLVHLCEVAIKEGVETTFVSGLIQKHNLVTARTDIDEWPHYLKIYTLGRFSILRKNIPLSFSRKPHRKLMELLKILISHGGRDVDVWQICEIMWPEAEGDAAYHAFETTVYRLRKLIGLEQAITIQSRKVSLNNHYVWVDVWAFERLHSEIESNTRNNIQASQIKDLIESTEKSFSLYRGHFLDSHQTDYWAISMRERVKSKFIRQLITMGQMLESRNEWGHAIQCYQKGLELDELIEEFYQKLIMCYGKLGRTAEALVIYRQCKRVLSIVLSISPSAETELLVQKIKNNTL